MKSIAVKWKVSFVLAFVLWFGVANTGATFAASVTDVIPQVVGKVAPSVVAIIGKPNGSAEKQSGWDRFDLEHGTGVIVRSDGYIVTNAHVVKEMRNLVVITSDGTSYPGKTTHYDEESDLALVKIDATGLPEAKFADPADITTGETVIAIGTPISFALRNSVTVGIISGIDRSVNSKYALLQTDAAINPGNSGGALVNMRGEVVGINSMKFVDDNVDNLGFAIPVDTVQYVLDHFFKYGKVMRPYLGVELEESWEAVVGLPSQDSLTVAYVDPDSPASKAGIRQGDAIVAFDGKEVRTIVEYNELMKRYLPGETVRVTVRSEDVTTVREVVLGEEPSGGENRPNDTDDGSGLDPDRGKTRIGDSHFGWSMKYPAGLVKVNQSDEGDYVLFADAKGEFGIEISVEESGVPLSTAALLRQISRYAPGTLLEKRIVESEDGTDYAKLVGKDESGSYYELRAFPKNGKVYYVHLYVEEEDNFKNKNKYNVYSDLLNSFRPTFDAEDEALKDISVYRTGPTTVTNEYGLSFELPPGWEEDFWSNGSSWHSEDGSRKIYVRVTSASSGETVSDWAAREKRLFENMLAEKFRATSGEETVSVAGTTGKQNRYSWTMGDKWQSMHAVYFIKDKYKYEIDFLFDKDDDREEIDKLIRDVVASVAVSKDLTNTSLGFIQDDDELIDENGSVTYRNDKYRYAVDIPEMWLGEPSGPLVGMDEFDSIDYDGGMDRLGKDSDKVTVSFLGGTMTIEADEKSTVDEVVQELEKSHKKSKENDSDYQYAITDDNRFGVPGKKIETTYPLKRAPYQMTEYVFRKDGITFTVSIRMNDAVRTEENVARVEAVLKSFRTNPDGSQS